MTRWRYTATRFDQNVGVVSHDGDVWPARFIEMTNARHDPRRVGRAADIAPGCTAVRRPPARVP